MTIHPAVAWRLIQAIVRAVKARRAKRRATHRDDIQAIGRIEDRTVADLPEKPTENE